MRTLVKASLLTAIAWVFASPASAATLTLTDTFGGTNTIWTLTVQTGCTTCSVTLSGFFQDPDGGGPGLNVYTGTYLDAVQWVIDSPNVNPTVDGFQSTNAGSASDWNFSLDASLSGGNQCNGGGQDALCGAWVGGGTGNGFQIANGSTLNWAFLTTFEQTDPDEPALPDILVSGNIRASFNEVVINNNGKIQVHNFNVFSPDGGGFQTSTTSTTTTPTTTTATPTTTTGIVPEPTMLTLLGAGLVMASRRLRRKTT